MKQLTVNITREFTPEMERLRRGGFAGENLHENCIDEFDSCSLHVVTRIDHELAGLLRLTPNPPSVLQKWSGGKAPLPHGNGVVCFTRAVVQAKFQGLGLYKLMMLDAIRFMGDTSAKVAVGVIKPEDPWKNFLTRTGWKSVGEPIRSTHPEEGEILGQFIRRELHKHDDTITPHDTN